MTHTELIEQIKIGTHCIEMPNNPSKEDNYQLGKLAYELLDVTSQITRGYIYYRYKSGHLLGMVVTDLIPIKISEFLSAFKPKMVSVDELLKLIDYAESNHDYSIATETLRVLLGSPERLTQFLNDTKTPTHDTKTLKA